MLSSFLLCWIISYLLCKGKRLTKITQLNYENITLGRDDLAIPVTLEFVVNGVASDYFWS